MIAASPGASSHAMDISARGGALAGGRHARARRPLAVVTARQRLSADASQATHDPLKDRGLEPIHSSAAGIGDYDHDPGHWPGSEGIGDHSPQGGWGLKIKMTVGGAAPDGTRRSTVGALNMGICAVTGEYLP